MSIFLGKQYLGQSDNAHSDNLIDGLTSKVQEIVVKIRDKANEDDDEQ